MSAPFRPYERLVRIRVLGREFDVPEKNSLLRCFQYISPQTVPYGRFCWNQECQYCRIKIKLPDDTEQREIISCKFWASDGLEVTELSEELGWCLRRLLAAGNSEEKPDPL